VKRNRAFLDRIADKTYRYKATITGQFSPKAYPTDELLELKPGAKIMMVKNGGRWVNGTIGKVAAPIEDYDEILVEIDDQIHIVTRENWENHSHRYDSHERRVIKDVVGSFEQFPVRLSWAMTIHKGQGQTLQKVYIDLGRGAFASGQTYVALSRSTTLQGIVLSRRIRREDIIVDPIISNYDSTL
jgi:ATP-dependent exoDNAse (exonuclease V) alpha subunit